jgi:hypothetical protein
MAEKLIPGSKLFTEAYEAWIIAGSPRKFVYRNQAYLVGASGREFNPVTPPPAQDLYASTSTRGQGVRGVGSRR